MPASGCNATGDLVFSDASGIVAHDKAPITQLLNRAQHGDERARETLAAHVYEELRMIARGKLRGKWRAGGLRTTELVHEGYLRLLKQTRVHWKNRAHFYAIAATEMRRVLLDLARRELASKRGGGVIHLEIQESAVTTTHPISLSDLVSVDAALDALAVVEPRQARVIELRAFGGLSIEETAEVMTMSETTVKRDWAAAIDWLSDHVAAGPPGQ